MPFREPAHDLLEPRIPVELERIEAFGGIADLAHPRLDLRFALNLDLAHLRTQPDHRARELEQVRLECPQLAFDPGAGDRDLARLAHQPVDRVGPPTSEE